MDKEKVKQFLKELDELCDEYGIEIIAEGTSPLLYDTEKRDYIGEFGRSFLGGGYKLYED